MVVAFPRIYKAASAEAQDVLHDKVPNNGTLRAYRYSYDTPSRIRYRHYPFRQNTRDQAYYYYSGNYGCDTYLFSPPLVYGIYFTRLYPLSMRPCKCIIHTDTEVGALEARGGLLGKYMPVRECAMGWYSQHVGEAGKRDGYKKQELPGGDHSALGDCRATIVDLAKIVGVSQ